MPFSAKMSGNNITRRDFLKILNTTIWAVIGLLGLDVLLRFLNTQTDPQPQSDFDIASSDTYPIGSRTVIASIPALLIHNENGFTAISLVCTHLGCTLESKQDGFACPCHGSMFDLKGNVVRGPANKSLSMLKVAVTADGRLHVYTDASVQ